MYSLVNATIARDAGSKWLTVSAKGSGVFGICIKGKAFKTHLDQKVYIPINFSEDSLNKDCQIFITSETNLLIKNALTNQPTINYESTTKDKFLTFNSDTTVDTPRFAIRATYANEPSFKFSLDQIQLDTENS
jgi:hypothetical protein